MGQLISKSGHRFLHTLNTQGILKDDELKLCIRADKESDPNLFLGFFLFKPDLDLHYCPICSIPTSMCAFPNQHEQYWFRSGLQLHQWQVDQLLCKTKDAFGRNASTIVLLGGPGCGKSTFLAVALGWLMCALNPGFINLTAAPTAKQNDAVITEYNKWVIGTRGWEVFMSPEEKKERPIFKYLFRNGSEHRIFTTAAISGGIKANDRNYSLEGDVLAYDEAGIDTSFGESLRVLGSRTRGLRPDGTHRGMVYPDGSLRSPMLIISNPHADNLEFDEFVNLIPEMPTFSLVAIDIEDNSILTENQIEDVTQRTIASFLITGGTEEDAMDALAGRQTTGDGEVFTNKAVKSVVRQDYDISEHILSHLTGPERSDNNFTFLLPKQEKHVYLITCDPGVGGAPRRNAPVIMLWDITNPELPPLVGLYWGSPIAGEALYLDTLAAWIRAFKAYAYVDTTGPQKTLLESRRLIGVEHWLYPVDFSGSYKGTAQWVMQMATTRGSYVLPKLPQPYTFERYMRRYKWKDEKITQDLIIGIMLLTLWQHQTVSFDEKKEEPEREQVQLERHIAHVRGMTVATR